MRIALLSAFLFAVTACGGTSQAPPVDIDKDPTPAIPVQTPPSPAPSVNGVPMPAPVRSAVRYTIISPIEKFGPDATQSAEARCRSAKDALVTGGCQIGAPDTAELLSSSPIVPLDTTESSYWLCVARNSGHQEAEVWAVIVCDAP